jgi:hypothetical protein
LRALFSTPGQVRIRNRKYLQRDVSQNRPIFPARRHWRRLANALTRPVRDARIRGKTGNEFRENRFSRSDFVVFRRIEARSQAISRKFEEVIVSQDASEMAAAILARGRKKNYNREEWFALIKYAIVTTSPDQKLPPLSGRLGADTEEKALELIYGAIINARSASDDLSVPIIAAPIRHIFYARH